MCLQTKKRFTIIVLALFSLFFAQLSSAGSNSFIACRTTPQVLAVATAIATRGHAPFKVDLSGAQSNIGTSTCNNVKFHASYNWKSALGHYATGQQTQIIFDTPGIHKIDLTVKNNYGKSDTTSISVTVLDNDTQRTLELQQEYAKGISQGHADCVANPVSCGIDIGYSEQELQQQFDNGFIVGLDDGKQSCILDPGSCGISVAETDTSKCSNGTFSICSEQHTSELILTLKTNETLGLNNEHHSILIENNATGLQNFGVSVAYLIQDGSLYQYTGDGSSWAWEYITALEDPIMANDSISYTINLDELDIYSGHSYKILGLIEDNNWEVINQTAILQQLAD